MIYQPIVGFSGINRQVSPFLTKQGELSEAQNFTTSKIGTLLKTGDYEILNAQITASQNIVGGIAILNTNGNYRHSVACAGVSNTYIYDEGGSWQSTTPALTNGYKVRFAYSPTLNEIFAVNYGDASMVRDADALGTAWSTSGDISGAPKGKYVLPFGSRMYIFNTVIGVTAYYTRAYRSSLMDSGSITWDTTNDWITFDDIITGAGYNGPNLFVGCKNSCQIFTLADQKYKITDKGCVSNESIVSYDNLTFWASDDGVYQTNGGNVKKISLPIQEYWDAISASSLSGIQIGLLKDHLYVAIGSITLDGATLSNVVFDYDILQNNWNRLSLGDTVKNFHYGDTETGRTLFMGNDDGEVFEMFSSGSQNTGEFKSSIETNWFYGSNPKFKEDFYELWGYGKQLSGLKVYYKLDDSKWQPIGELNGSIDFVKFKGRGNRIKFLLQETSKNNLFQLDMLEIGYVPQYVKEDDE